MDAERQPISSVSAERRLAERTIPETLDAERIAAQNELAYRRGFAAGRAATADAVQIQKDATFEAMALELVILRTVFNATAAHAHEREALIEGWKLEAADWKSEHDRVHRELCDFTSEALAIVEGLVTERLRQKFYACKRVWKIRAEFAPNDIDRDGNKETWAAWFLRIFHQDIEAFAREAKEKNYRKLIKDYEIAAFGSSPLDEPKEQAA